MDGYVTRAVLERKSLCMRVFFTLIFLATLLVGCDKPFNTELQTYSLDPRFSISLPKGLQPMSGLHEFAPIQFGDDVIGLYAIALEESKKEIDSVNLSYTAREYSHFALRNVTIGLDSVLTENSMDYILSPFSCYATDVTGLKTVDGELYPVHTKLVVFESPTHFYQVMLWTGADQLPEFEPLMEQVICSAQAIPYTEPTSPPDQPSGESSQYGMR